MYRIFCILIGITIPLSLFAKTTCLQEITRRADMISEEARSHIIGMPKAIDSVIFSTRYDKNGNQWMKTAGDEWKRLGSEDVKKSKDMENEAFTPSQAGWLEMMHADTTDLIPPILQTLRAESCRLDALCQQVQLSKKDEKITIKIPGCIEFKDVDSINACASDTNITINERDASFTECNDIVHTVAKHDQRIAESLIAYDAAFRSAIQIAGVIDDFMDQFSFPSLTPLWTMVENFLKLGNIPCITSQCES